MTKQTGNFQKVLYEICCYFHNFLIQFFQKKLKVSEYLPSTPKKEEYLTENEKFNKTVFVRSHVLVQRSVFLTKKGRKSHVTVA